MRIEIVVIYILAFIDIMATYYMLYLTKKQGHKNWADAEQNKVVQFFLKKFGLHNGVRLSAIFTFSVLTGAMFYLNARVNAYDFSRMIFFLMGAYFIVLTYHILFLNKFLEQSKQGKGGGDR
jgi:hypothetical protein